MRPTDTETSADIQILDGAHAVRVYDDGHGPLWVYRESLGICGVIRASSWEDAWSIVEDEFLAEADGTWEDIAKECDCDDPETLMDNAIFQECHGFRPNGQNSRDVHGHGIYARDLNGESLDLLTPKLLEHLKLVIVPAPTNVRD